MTTIPVSTNINESILFFLKNVAYTKVWYNFKYSNLMITFVY